MTHLTESQFVDVLEGRPEPLGRVADHLATCTACQAELASLGEILGVARAVEAPEPSPLFWDHFSRRVRAAIADEPAPVPAVWWNGARVWQPLAAIGTVAVVLAALWVARSAHERRLAEPVGTVATATLAGESSGLAAGSGELIDDARLNVMAVVAQDVRTDDLRQIAQPSADATGAAIENLTPAQCAALMRLIKAQMSGTE